MDGVRSITLVPSGLLSLVVAPGRHGSNERKPNACAKYIWLRVDLFRSSQNFIQEHTAKNRNNWDTLQIDVGRTSGQYANNQATPSLHRTTTLLAPSHIHVGVALTYLPCHLPQ